MRHGSAATKAECESEEKEDGEEPVHVPEAFGGSWRARSGGARLGGLEPVRMKPRREATPTERWQLAVDWMNWSFEAYLQAQVAAGFTHEEAMARLKSAWEREDRERLEAIRRIGERTARAG
ncbi:MAG: hypothetical protein FJX76_14525 [Armatimonadetes bacterium]|nr:hypothetical protein [Armatimonadota bacterium]